MKLRDLSDEMAHPRPAKGGREAHSTAKPEPRAKTSCPAGLPGVRWLVLESRLLDDEPFLVVFKKKDLRAARKAHPGKVVYLQPEVEELRRLKTAPDYLTALGIIHAAKKRFGAWIVPSGARYVRRHTMRNEPCDVEQEDRVISRR